MRGGPRPPCYVRPALPGSGTILRGSAAAAAAALLLAGGCGEDERQDAGAQEASYRVVVHERFPARQRVAQPAEMRIAVRNLSRRTIPNVVVTIVAAGGGTDSEAFAAPTDEPGLASRSRPVWIVDEGPANAETAYANTWAVGALAPGRSKELRWSVTPVTPGRHAIEYRLSGSLTGEAELRLRDGRLPRGRLAVEVSDRPPGVRVTDDGRIVRR